MCQIGSSASRRGLTDRVDDAVEAPPVEEGVTTSEEGVTISEGVTTSGESGRTDGEHEPRTATETHTLIRTRIRATDRFAMRRLGNGNGLLARAVFVSLRGNYTPGNRTTRINTSMSPTIPITARRGVHVCSVSFSVNPLILQTTQKPLSFIQEMTSEPKPMAAKM